MLSKKMNLSDINLSRDSVIGCYESAIRLHNEECNKTEPYNYDNQKTDATNITGIFYKNHNGDNKTRVLSVQKRTKVGADGLMIELAVKMSTHLDDDFCLHRKNINFITGLSSVDWETTLKKKFPTCFAENVYHHGKLPQLKKILINPTNTLFIVDEIDTGSKDNQSLHSLLRDSGVLDIKYMNDNNIRFVFISATIRNEMSELCKWGDKHQTYFMTIPKTYVGHKDFLEMGIIQPYYKIDSVEPAEKWIKEDIIDNYGSDYRVHIIRSSKKKVHYIECACARLNIDFRNHTSTDRISEDQLIDIFENTQLTNHLVIIIKGFWRRAQLIKNKWKLKIGATHEMYGLCADENVQVQGLPGRMTGYWRYVLIDDNGHRTEFKTGPYRTCVDSIISYEESYENIYENKGGSIGPTGNYGIQKKMSFLQPKNIKNLVPVETTHEKNINTEKAEKEAKKAENQAKKAEKQSKKQREDEFKRIPIVIEGLTDDDIKKLTNKKEKISNLKKEKISHLYTKINDQKLLDFLRKTDNVQFTAPLVDNSYKKHITDLVNAKMKGTKYIIHLKNDEKEVNSWQAYVDTRQKRVCILIWCVDGSY